MALFSKLILVLGGSLLFVYSHSLFAQPSYTWALGVGSGMADASSSIALDASGNVFSTGNFRQTVDFDPGSGTASVTSTSQADAYISKYSATGTYLWAIKLGSTGYDQGQMVVTDASGNVYCLGYFSGTVDFDPGAGIANLISAGGYDVFLAKYSAAGIYQWAFKLGDASDDYGYGMCIDATSNVYITGTYKGTMDLDPGTGVVSVTSLSSTYDVFVGVYNASGAYQNGFTIGSNTGGASDAGKSIAADASGNIYLFGDFQGKIDLDPSAATVYFTSIGSVTTDMFLAKYTSSGAYQWGFSLGSSTTNEFARCVKLDASMNVYITGNLGGNGDFDPGSGTANLSFTPSASGNATCFLAKYSNSGSYLWAFAYSTAYAVHGRSLDIDASGNVYLTADMQGATYVDPPANTVSYAGAAMYEILVAKYASDGSYVWSFSVGTSGLNVVNQILVDNSNNVYLTGGYMYGNLNPSNTSAVLTAYGSSDIFIAKYTETSLPLDLLRFEGKMVGDLVYFEWEVTAEELGTRYGIEVKSEEGEFAAVQEYEGDGSAKYFSSHAIEKGRDYYFRLKIDEAGQLHYSETILVRQENDEVRVRIVGQRIVVDADQAAEAMLLCDVKGEIVYSGAFRNETDLSSHPTGIYMVKLVFPAGEKSLKLYYDGF